ncbi:MAG: DNA-binding domain-containing protein [Vicinamibacterales bacterium]|nr:DNA-binding domain-containing protein [Vicinamibacterales bacterium]
MLADLQRRFRGAVVTGDGRALLPHLTGPDGSRPVSRLGIYLRHYSASLVEAVMNRFPATGWLIGSTPVHEAAQAFVRRHPPQAPCIAEYGQAFPAFLEDAVPNSGLPLAAFAELDWQLGRLAAGVPLPAQSGAELLEAAGSDLPTRGLVLQPATHYLHAPAPIDTLMGLYLSEDAPARWALTDEPVWLHMRGNRGDVRFERLAAGDFTFRRGLARGLSLEAAADAALSLDSSFQPGPALAALLSAGLVVGVSTTPGSSAS